MGFEPQNCRFPSPRQWQSLPGAKARNPSKIATGAGFRNRAKGFAPPRRESLHPVTFPPPQFPLSSCSDWCFLAWHLVAPRPAPHLYRPAYASFSLCWLFFALSCVVATVTLARLRPRPYCHCAAAAVALPSLATADFRWGGYHGPENQSPPGILDLPFTARGEKPSTNHHGPLRNISSWVSRSLAFRLTHKVSRQLLNFLP